jgi:predicted enzyme related to lactoylglutathione lyase
MKSIKEPTLGNGKICYLEIPANNVEESSAFYNKIFGWHIRTRGDGNTAFDDGIGEVSGAWVMGRKPHTEAGLVVSIMVDSLAETVDLLTANGSKIVNRIKISETEEVAWFADPAGNILGLYQHPGGGNGKICYVEIPAADITGSANFYHAIFGWPLRDKGSDRVSFDDSVGVVSGMWVHNRKPSTEPGLMIYVMADDAAATVNAVKIHGGKIVQPIGHDAPEITARFADPFGNVLGIYQNPE